MLEAFDREAQEMRSCREYDDDNGCDARGACDHCLLRLDYLSALEALIEIAERRDS